MFGWDFEVDAWSRFWRWNLIKICVRTCDINSTLRSIVPLAMFYPCHSLPNWLTDCCWVNLIDVTLACEDAKSKLVEAVSVADVDAKDNVGNSLLQIWELNFCSDFEHKGWSSFAVEAQARFWSWILFSILPLMFCRDYEIESWSRVWSWVWPRFWILSLVEMLVFGWNF